METNAEAGKDGKAGETTLDVLVRRVKETHGPEHMALEYLRYEELRKMNARQFLQLHEGWAGHEGGIATANEIDRLADQSILAGKPPGTTMDDVVRDLLETGGRSLDELALGALRHKELRCLSPDEFTELHRRNVRGGEWFDDMVTALVESGASSRPPSAKVVRSAILNGRDAPASGSVVHLVPGWDGVEYCHNAALCDRRPGPRSAGWCVVRSAPTCGKCVKRRDKLRRKETGASPKPVRNPRKNPR